MITVDVVVSMKSESILSVLVDALLNCQPPVLTNIMI